MAKRLRPIDDTLLASWLRMLKPQTAKNNKACFVRLLGIMKIDSRTLLENAEKDAVKTWKEIKQAAKVEDRPGLMVCYSMAPEAWFSRHSNQVPATVEGQAPAGGGFTDPRAGTHVETGATIGPSRSYLRF